MSKVREILTKLCPLFDSTIKGIEKYQLTYAVDPPPPPPPHTHTHTHPLLTPPAPHPKNKEKWILCQNSLTTELKIRVVGFVLKKLLTNFELLVSLPPPPPRPPPTPPPVPPQFPFLKKKGKKDKVNGNVILKKYNK